QTTRNTLLSVVVMLLWVLWVLRAMPSFWLLLIIVTLPLANAVLDRAIENLLRPPGSPQTSTASHNVVAGPRSTRRRALPAPTFIPSQPTFIPSQPTFIPSQTRVRFGA